MSVSPCLNPQNDLACQHVNRLVLLVVILQTEHVPRLDMQDLTDVAIGFRPDQLVAPRLLDAIRQLAHASLSFSDDGIVTQARGHTRRNRRTLRASEPVAAFVQRERHLADRACAARTRPHCRLET